MTARWLRVVVRCSPADAVDRLVEGLLAAGGSAVQEEGDLLISHIPLDSEAAAAAGDRVRRQLAAVLGFEPADFAFDEMPEQDWLALWRAGLQPRPVGDRVIVSPTWSDVSAAAGQVVVRIDPQMAFGTGEHASTRGVLRLMQAVIRPGDRLLDVGSGSAILAIAAALLGAAHVTAAESDAEAQPNAAENVARNGVADRVSLLCDVVDDAFLARAGTAAFDGILANVLSSVLVPLLPAFRRATKSGGWVILAGILIEEADTVGAAARAAGFAIDAEDTEEQWWSVRLRNTSQ